MTERQASPRRVSSALTVKVELPNERQEVPVIVVGREEALESSNL